LPWNGRIAVIGSELPIKYGVQAESRNSDERRFLAEAEIYWMILEAVDDTKYPKVGGPFLRSDHFWQRQIETWPSPSLGP
jgi:hypothetical protein